jgi:aminoethylphosphonate catabolism LysR family transcriptional regulator
MNSHQLRAFHAVVAEGGFTKAARRIGLSQPAVSGHVKALEQWVGAPLLRRTGQKVEPTPTGDMLYARARQILALIDDLDDEVRAAGRLERGELRLGADAPYLAMPLLAAVLRAHPGLRLRVSLANTERVIGDLLADRTDMAIFTEVVARTGLHRQQLVTDRLTALVPAGHPWASRSALRLEDLHEAPLVQREPGSATRALLERALAVSGVRPREVLELGTREAMREAVATGLGLGMLFRTETIADPRLRAVPLEGDGLEAPIVLACLAERAELRLTGALLALARAQLPA